MGGVGATQDAASLAAGASPASALAINIAAEGLLTAVPATTDRREGHSSTAVR